MSTECILHAEFRQWIGSRSNTHKPTADMKRPELPVSIERSLSFWFLGLILKQEDASGRQSVWMNQLHVTLVKSQHVERKVAACSSHHLYKCFKLPSHEHGILLCSAKAKIDSCPL